MKKLTRNSLDELAKVMPVISENEQRFYVGGNGGEIPSGSHTQPYTWEEYQALIASGNWNGGFVVDCDISETGEKTTSGWFGSHYIGPTNDETLRTLPSPTHAADYIAQQHDLEYQSLSLSGFSGTLSPKSREADERLIQRCNELISNYKSGIMTYGGYPITEQAYKAAKYMKDYFVMEQGITGIVQ